MTGFSTILRAMAAALLIAAAAPAARAQQVPLQDKPFAEHRIVLQLSDSDPKKQGLVISVANNLMKFYDPDKVAIEVVTFGPGIELLRPDNANRKRVESLVAQGARFDICLNTVDTLERETGKRPEFIVGRNPGAGRRRANSASDRKRLYAGEAMNLYTVIASDRPQCSHPLVDCRAKRKRFRLSPARISMDCLRRIHASGVNDECKSRAGTTSGPDTI